MSDPQRKESSSAATEGAEAGSWHLTREALTKLLAFLDPDPEAAAERFERIRFRLTRMLAWRGAIYPEELVDETVNRVARKIDQGEEIRTDKPYRYFAGVARLVFHETIRRERREREVLAQEDWPPTQEDPREQVERERRLDCLRRAMEELPKGSRRLILTYYTGEKGTKIKNRKHLAADLGIPMNALRIRAHRIRLKLEASVSQCLEEEDD